jgi:hypothetical protein
LKYIIFLFVCVTFLGCEKVINIAPANVEDKLVVDATIENNMVPFVTLSTSLKYFSTLSLTQLQNSFVNNAVVTISNGTRIITLKEYGIPITGGLVYVYAPNLNADTSFKGELGKTYTLNITTANGKTYNATTSIPQIRKRIDSLRWRPAPAIVDSPNRAVVLGRFFEPTPLGDYIRFATKVNREPFYYGRASVVDDFFVDGQSYEFQIDKNNDILNPNNDAYKEFYKRGDTVTLKVSNIDKPSFDFWSTLEFSISNVGNPFGSPITVQTNIKGNPALGVFTGYATQYKTIIIPR